MTSTTMDKQQAAREAMNFDAPQTAEAWAFAMAEACNAAMKAGAWAEQDTFLHVVQYIQAQAAQAAQAALMPALVEARDALECVQRAYLSHLEWESCQRALARINSVIGDKK